MKKRILSILMVAMMVLTMMPAMAFAETDQETARFTVKSESSAAVVDSGICGDDLSWELDSEGALKISGTGAMYDYSDDLSAPWRDETIFKVVIEEGVTSVGAYAFANCGLKQVVIPSTVKIIKECFL